MIVEPTGWVAATAPVPPVTAALASVMADPSQVGAAAGQVTSESSAKVPKALHVYRVVAAASPKPAL